MRILERNPYTKSFKGLCEILELEKHRIIFNSNPDLDQRVYNLPTASQVVASWIEINDETIDKNAHIQVYNHSNASH